MHNHLQGLQRIVRKTENIQCAAVVWMKMPCWSQRRMGRLFQDNRNATVGQMTTCYNHGMQNTISESTTLQTLKQMGYSSRIPHQVPLLSGKILHHVTKLRSSQTWFLNMMNSLYSNGFQGRQITIPIEHLWDVVEEEILIMEAQLINLQQLCDAIMSVLTIL